MAGDICHAFHATSLHGGPWYPNDGRFLSHRGHAPHLPWFLRRLAAQGLAPRRQTIAPAAAADWIGLEFADGWLDLGRDGDPALAERPPIAAPSACLSRNWPATGCPQAANSASCCWWATPPARLAGARRTGRAGAQPGCWLHSGPSTARVSASAPSPACCTRASSPCRRQTASRGRWTGKARCAGNGRWPTSCARWPKPTWPSGSASSHRIRPRPDAAAHYAANLARTILLAMPDGQAWAALQNELAASRKSHPAPGNEKPPRHAVGGMT
ncbi:Uncharacterised protein [Chromobacterium violaceum]|uniref:Uncharacterized protein n=1 Tax=Chromobacterium violaceum TaxID=536 RepID=A0A3S4HKS6_CHRVL|nr:Uncharacterised protein [Chromobacterium violaceum]